MNDSLNLLSGIDGPLSPPQLREVFALLAYANLRLAERPVFYTDFSSVPGSIRARRPRHIKMKEHDPEILGEMIYTCVERFLDVMLNQDAEEIRANVKAGTCSFLYDENGEFIKNSVMNA